MQNLWLGIDGRSVRSSSLHRVWDCSVNILLRWTKMASQQEINAAIQEAMKTGFNMTPREWQLEDMARILTGWNIHTSLVVVMRATHTVFHCHDGLIIGMRDFSIKRFEVCLILGNQDRKFGFWSTYYNVLQ